MDTTKYISLENIDFGLLVDMYLDRREEKNLAWYMGQKEFYRIGRLRDAVGRYVIDFNTPVMNSKLFGLDIIILGITADVYLGRNPAQECPQCGNTLAPYPETGNCSGCGVNRVKQ